MTTQIDYVRLAEVGTWQLNAGQHPEPTEDSSDGACILEAVAYVAREDWTDHPECVCPVIAAFLRSWNDGLPDADRTRLLLPLVPRLVGTRSTPDVELRRSRMALDWLVREHAPVWLDLVPSLAEHAAGLRALPELVDGVTVGAALVVLDRARVAAAAASDIARAAATWDAASDAAWDATWDVAWDVAWDAARSAAKAAASDAAWYVASAVAWDVASDRLRATVAQLQQSALRLLERMIAVTEGGDPTDVPTRADHEGRAAGAYARSGHTNRRAKR